MAKKKAVKKRMARKKLAKKKPARKAETGGLGLPLDSLLKGQRICLAGHFSWNPSKKDVQDVIRLLGGTVTEKVDGKLTTLLIGSGRRPAKQAQAQKLNASGAASIQILTTPRDLLPVDFSDRLPEFITDPNSLPLLKRILEEYWLFSGSPPEIHGADFSGQLLGAQKTHWVNARMVDCDFSRATITNLHFSSMRDDSHSRCLFDRTTFANSDFGNLDNSVLAGVSGTEFGCFELRRCRMDKARLDDLDTYYVQECEVTNSQIGKFTVRGSLHGLYQSAFRKVKFGEIYWDADCQDCELDDVEIGGGTLDNLLVFSKTKLRNVRFRNLAVNALVFDKCELVNCLFEGNQFGAFDFGGSAVSGCKLKNSQIDVALISEKQRSGLRGLDANRLIAALTDFPQVKKLGRAMEKSDTLEIHFDGSRGRDVVSLTMGTNYSRNFAFRSKKSRKHAGDFQFPFNADPKADDFARQVLWLIQASGIDELHLGSLKTKTSKCPHKPKQLKEIVIGAVLEAIGNQTTSLESLQSAAKESKKQACQTGQRNVRRQDAVSGVGHARRLEETRLVRLRIATAPTQAEQEGVLSIAVCHVADPQFIRVSTSAT